MPYKILVADDEPDVAQLIKDSFEMNDYTVITASDGKEAVEQSQKNPDLIILDINMPYIDGIEVCRQIRSYVSCPILFLTARITDSDKIAGFAAGGDDYIIKPFSIDELLARAAAHLRREQRLQQQTNVRFFGTLTIDYSAKSVKSRNTELNMAKKEFEIIELLSLNPGQVFDKEKIYEKIWGYDAEGDSCVVAEHIRRLRAKLSACGEQQHIETVWGMGYKWVK
ncbi:MAG: response regulator transcription factor [Oscillospiraceae bacterium]|nr:response regulator transcription factor [Oscillospiraceae bacterium]